MILIVEDDDSIRETLKMFLDCIGQKCIEARTLKEGLEKIDDCSTILLDMLLAGEDGAPIIAAARKLKRPPYIVMMTALQNADKLAEELKPDSLLKKPFDLDTLMNLLH